MFTNMLSQRVTEEFHFGQGVKLQNTPWSSGQGLKTAVKNLDPGRKREYSKYGSDLPLICITTVSFPTT